MGLKILRIGVAHGGRLVEDRLIRHRDDVTVGQSSRATLQVPFEELPRSFLLFERHGAGYTLRFTEAMDGRISLEEGDPPMTLEELRGAATRQGGIYQLALTEGSRGKVSIGELTLLFQLVDPPPQRARPRLPPSVRSSILKNLDWVMIAIVGLSFATHGALVLYLRGVDYPHRPDIESIPERFPVLTTQPIRVRMTEDPIAPTPSERVNPNTGRGSSGVRSGPRVRPSLAVHRPTVDEMANYGLLRLIAAKNGEGGLVADLLKPGAPSDDDDRVFQEIGGVGVATSNNTGLHARGSSRIGTVADIGDMRGPHGPAEVDTGERRGEHEAPPGKIDTTLGPVDPEDPTMVPTIIAEIHRRRGGIQACYDIAGRHHPGIGGKIQLRFTLSVIGKLTHVEVEEDTVGEPELSSCMTRTVSTWRFPPSEKGEVSFSYPFVFQAPALGGRPAR